jgi:hypothetical protein
MFTYGVCLASEVNTNDLVVPPRIEQELRAIPVQKVDFTISNSTDHVISIKNYTVLCECTQVATKDKTLLPHTTTEARAYIRRNEPYVASVFIQDDKEHWYRTDIVLTRKFSPPQ